MNRQWRETMESDRLWYLSFSLSQGADSEQVAVLAFSSQGALLMKIPQAEAVTDRRGGCHVRCFVPQGAETLCILAGTAPFSVRIGHRSLAGEEYHDF